MASSSMVKTSGYAAMAANEALKQWSFDHRSIGEKDVHIKIKYCGVCHSDIHQVRDDWMPGTYPMVPGHEIVGIVEGVGKNVTNMKKGDVVAVGCMVDSCRSCTGCKSNLEQCCPSVSFTYNSKLKNGMPTYGGYAKDIVVDEDFVCTVPKSLHGNLAGVAPLLCAGITTYSPLMQYGMNKPGKKVGVIGLGGLGHMAVKFAVAFGNEVTVMSTSASKEKEAKEVFGAKNFCVTTDPASVQQHIGTLDFIIDTVAVAKSMALYTSFLKNGGVIVEVGVPPNCNLEIPPMLLVMNRLSVAGSLIGGMKETQEMLNFCGEKNILANVEVIKMDEINRAYERMDKSDVKYRFVIDMDASKL